jgi:hypothetical protein
VSFDVALSYAGEDRARAEEIISQLEAVGLSVWADVARMRGDDAAGIGEPRVPGGARWRELAGDAIDESATVVLLQTEFWAASDACRFEYDHAVARGKRIVALRRAAESVPPFPEAQYGVAAIVIDSDRDALVAAIREHLEVGRAHARLTVAAHRTRDAEAATTVAADARDAQLVATAGLQAAGMRAPQELIAAIEATLTSARRRRRRLGGLAAAAVVALAVSGGIAWRSGHKASVAARSSQDAERHAQSLSLAAASENATETTSRIGKARQAVDLETNPTTLQALRDAIDGLSAGIRLDIDLSDVPVAVAVSDTGRAAAVVSRSGAVSIVTIGVAVRQRLVSAGVANASGVLAIAPDSSSVLVVQRRGGVAAIVDVASGRTKVIPGTTSIAGIAFVSARKAVAVQRDGSLIGLVLNARGDARAQRLGRLRGPVRTAAVAGPGSNGAPIVAVLTDDGTVRLVDFGRGGTTVWQRALTSPNGHGRLAPGRWVPGRDVIRRCGGRLSVLTTGSPSGSASTFNIPYTIYEDGRAVSTGSSVYTIGTMCLPDGNVMGIDALRGAYAFPAGDTLAGVLRDPRERVIYAVATSENGAWAALTGSDKTLRLLPLASAPVERSVDSLGSLAADGQAALVVDQSGATSRLTGDGVAHPVPGVPRGEVAFGAYADRSLGAVLALGTRVIVVRHGRVAVSRRAGDRVDRIRPGRPGDSALAIGAHRDRVRVLSLRSRGGDDRVVRLPTSVARAAIWDVALVGRSDTLAVATRDGAVHLVSPKGRVTRARRVGPPGRIMVVATPRRRLVVGTGDGVVHLLDGRTLRELRSSAAVPGQVLDLEVDATGRLLAVVSTNDRAAVLDLPQLDTLTHVGPIRGMVAATFDGASRALLVGTNVDLVDGSADASVMRWPICRPCGGGARELQASVRGIFGRVASAQSGAKRAFVPRPPPRPRIRQPPKDPADQL